MLPVGLNPPTTAPAANDPKKPATCGFTPIASNPLETAKLTPIETTERAISMPILEELATNPKKFPNALVASLKTPLTTSKALTANVPMGPRASVIPLNTSLKKPPILTAPKVTIEDIALIKSPSTRLTATDIALRTQPNCCSPGIGIQLRIDPIRPNKLPKNAPRIFCAA
jgi:hypothetical protein